METVLYMENDPWKRAFSVAETKIVKAVMAAGKPVRAPAPVEAPPEPPRKAVLASHRKPKQAPPEEPESLPQTPLELVLRLRSMDPMSPRCPRCFEGWVMSRPLCAHCDYRDPLVNVFVAFGVECATAPIVVDVDVGIELVRALSDMLTDDELLITAHAFWSTRKTVPSRSFRNAT